MDNLIDVSKIEGSDLIFNLLYYDLYRLSVKETILIQSQPTTFMKCFNILSIIWMPF